MSLNANWRPRSWLVSDATIGFDLANRDNSDLCRKGECAPSSSVIRAGQVSDAKRNDRTVSAKLSSTGSWTARSWLNLKTTVGGDYTNVEFDATNSSGITLPPGGSTVDQAATRSGGATWPTATKTLGFYAQQQAELRDRLFLTVAARTDQNSAFGTKFQRVVYPKASVSWLASDESFFPRIPVHEFVPPAQRVRSERCAAGAHGCARDVRGREPESAKPRRRIDEWRRYAGTRRRPAWECGVTA
jgi:outer membrane receptor protein involved in Fe transport